jgi:phosphoglycolate phosphatase-like HAD superfamily hydrolase
MVEALSVHDDYGIALATGCLRRSAHFKLGAAGMDLEHCWGAYSEDGPARVDIVRAAMERADCCAEEIIYVGDGAWDVVCCRELEIPFVGITHQSNAQALRDAGAQVLLPDYADAEAFITALHKAKVPG